MTPHIDGSQVEQQPEIVEVAVIEGILVIPFDLQSHPVLVAVHLVGRRVELGVVHDDARIELLFPPAELGEVAVDLGGDVRFGAAGLEDVASQERESPQHGLDIRPFRRSGRGQNRKTVPPFADIVPLGDVGRDQRVILHAVILTGAVEPHKSK